MKLEELSARSGFPVSTIKYYLRDGVLPAGVRRSPRQVRYDQRHLERLQAIATLGALGRAPLRPFRQDDEPDVDRIRALLDEHGRSAVLDRLDDYEALARSLAALDAECVQDHETADPAAAAILDTVLGDALVAALRRRARREGTGATVVVDPAGAGAPDLEAVGAALDVVGRRWTLSVVAVLLGGVRRFTDLRRALPGIAPGILSQRLDDLVRSGLVRRRHLPAPAARDVYGLTGAGRELAPALHALERWGRPSAQDRRSA